MHSLVTQLYNQACGNRFRGIAQPFEFKKKKNGKITCMYFTVSPFYASLPVRPSGSCPQSTVLPRINIHGEMLDFPTFFFFSEFDFNLMCHESYKIVAHISK
jgi:hypothetical protein